MERKRLRLHRLVSRSDCKRPRFRASHYRRMRSFHRHQSKNSIVITRRITAAIPVRSRKIDVAVRPFRDIADASVFVFQQVFLAHGLSAVGDYANYSFAAQAAKKEVALEGRELRAPIKHPARSEEHTSELQ